MSHPNTTKDVILKALHKELNLNDDMEKILPAIFTISESFAQKDNNVLSEMTLQAKTLLEVSRLTRIIGEKLILESAIISNEELA